jgi:hypothetical protein
MAQAKIPHTFLLKLDPATSTAIDEFRWSARYQTAVEAVRALIKLGLEVAAQENAPQPQQQLTA